MVNLRGETGGAPGEGDVLTGINLVQGGTGDDVLLGTSIDDFIRGNDGDDLIRAFEGNDGVQGNRGRDRVFGGAGDDVASDDSDNAVDAQHCGPGEDYVPSSDKRDLLRHNCEDGGWSSAPDLGGDLINRITTRPALGRSLAVFRSTCVESPKCSGRIVLKTRGSRETLGRGKFEFRQYRGDNPDDAPRHEIVAVLNKRGREWVDGGGYVRVTIVSQHDCNGCLNPRPPARTGFTTYMRR
jgi:Ca2+-binding RTX toxin-like protein